MIAWCALAWAGGGPVEEPALSLGGSWLLETPRTRFYTDVDALVRHHLPRRLPNHTSTCAGERADLAQALGDVPDAELVVARWALVRCEPGADLPTDLLAAVPTEFRLYATGAARMYAGDDEGAVTAWRALLALPPAERRWRSTWAAYMLGNLAYTGAAGAGDPALAWAQVRTLAGAGFADSLGLADHASAADQDPVHQLRHVLHGLAAEGTAEAAGAELRARARALLDADAPVQERAARDPLVADVLSSFLTSRLGATERRSERAARWLVALEAAGQTAGADRVALVAYQEGRFDDAGRWAARADPAAPIGHWVRAKLHLRDGRTAAAAEELRLASALLGMEGTSPFVGYPTWYCPRGDTELDGGGRCVATELGALQLQLGDPEGALASFLSADDWLDAAWVAERVLTADELRAFVDRWYPHGDAPLRHLLARRLARAGRWDEALAYFPGDVADDAARVRELLARGRDGSASADERAEALWAAARRTKDRGWELLATEVAPDWRADGGSRREDPTEARLVGSDGSAEGSPPAERARLAASRPRPERFQFVYTAWDLAGEAAALLPDQSDALAEVLCTSGTWLSNRDLERSSQRWFELLRRAHRTAVGRATRGRSRWWGLGPDGVCVAPDAPAPPPSPSPSWGVVAAWALVWRWIRG